MLNASSPARRRGQWSLIGTLVAVALLLLLAGLYIPQLLKTHSGESGAEQSALQRADGTACTIYAPQLNAAVSEYKQDNGRPPTSLNDLKRYGVTDDMINAPGCAFQMDPNTGRVTNGSAPGVPGGAPGAPPSYSGGSPAPVTYGQPPAPGGAPAAPPNGGTRGPGGVTIPNMNPGGEGGM